MNRFNPSPSGTAPSPRLELSGKAEQFSALAAMVNHYVQGQIYSAKTTRSSTVVGETPGGITLQPLGLTRHPLNPVLLTFVGVQEKQRRTFCPGASPIWQMCWSRLIVISTLPTPRAADLPRRRSSRLKLPIWIGFRCCRRHCGHPGQPVVASANAPD